MGNAQALKLLGTTNFFAVVKYLFTMLDEIIRLLPLHVLGIQFTLSSQRDGHLKVVFPNHRGFVWNVLFVIISHRETLDYIKDP